MEKVLRRRLTCALALAAASFFGVLLGASRAYAEKIAFVDVAKVFDEYEKTKKNDGILAEESKKKQSERDAKVQEIRRLKDELALLADKNKDEKQELIDEKIRTLKAYDEAAREELSQKRDDAVKQILKDIDSVISEYGQKNGFDFVFNDRALLYRSDKYDVTVEILNDLNSRYRKDASNQ